MFLMTTDPLIQLNAIAQALFDKKGFNILVLDVRAISSLTEYVVIAEGLANKHVQALADAVLDQMGRMGRKPFYMEGIKEGDWVVLDFSYIVVHLFQPGWRDKYQLEQLWQQADIVDVQIDTAAKKCN
jgi:ribosome-associated protein